MGKDKYMVRGIAFPGLINVKIGGRFRDVELYNAPQDILAELHASGSPYVTLSPPAPAKSDIQVKQIAGKKRVTKPGN